MRINKSPESSYQVLIMQGRPLYRGPAFSCSFLGLEGQYVNSNSGGNDGQQNSQPQLVDQEDTQGNGQPQGRDRDGLHPPGDALVLLEVPYVRPQLGMRHQPGMQPR